MYEITTQQNKIVSENTIDEISFLVGYNKNLMGGD